MNADDLRKAITELLVPLQTMRGLDRDASVALLKATEALAVSMRGHDLVSKSLLNELYVTIRVLRNEAPHMKNDAAAVKEMADKLEYYFALILLDETPSDRIPGVPRIS